MRGGYNFRDLGGFAAADGKQVALGKLFRADSLGQLTDDDLALLNAIPITTIVDFRTEAEKTRLPDKLPGSVKHLLHYPIQPGGIDPREPGVDFGNDGGYGFMLKVSRELVLDKDIAATYRDFFQHVQQRSRLPLLFHCSAGKDRTGIAAGLILLSLGVDKEQVLADYMASAVFLQGKYDDIMARHPDKHELFGVRPEFFFAAVQAMEEHSGSVEEYLTGTLGVDLRRMRSLFLQ